MRIFDFVDYKEFLLKRVAAMPKGGRGEFLRIAKHLRMHSTRVSHIFRGEMNLTPEQAADLAVYLGLNKIESEYFLAQVHLARAGSSTLREQIKEQMLDQRRRAEELAERIPRTAALSEPEKAVFYSSWYYSALRLATSIESCGTIDALADRFQMPREKVRDVLEFLVATGLCEEANGRFHLGRQTTHLEKTSPLVLRHHTNWRLKAIARHEGLGPAEMAFSCPVSLTRADQAKIREKIFQFIEEYLKTVTASEPPEEIACLNIDWFTVK